MLNWISYILQKDRLKKELMFSVYQKMYKLKQKQFICEYQ